NFKVKPYLPFAKSETPVDPRSAIALRPLGPSPASPIPPAPPRTSPLPAALPSHRRRPRTAPSLSPWTTSPSLRISLPSPPPMPSPQRCPNALVGPPSVLSLSLSLSLSLGGGGDMGEVAAELEEAGLGLFGCALFGLIG
ncbi:hypothetical protein Taro_052519, partial [Colocasia esculenta]|nr:hypothetical protein [Colocasia esculenta]